MGRRETKNAYIKNHHEVKPWATSKSECTFVNLALSTLKELAPVEARSLGVCDPEFLVSLEVLLMKKGGYNNGETTFLEPRTMGVTGSKDASTLKP